MIQTPDKVRIDKWLWAARFFKTRSIASTAVDAGHVSLNGDRVKPARMVKTGDQLRILTAHGEFEITVLALSEQRGPAERAQTLYEESEQSLEKRTRLAEEKTLSPAVFPASKGRPTKKWRRQLHLFERQNS